MSDRFEKMSIVSQSARPQIGVAIALITIIPLLVVIYLFFGGSAYDSENVWRSVIVILIVILSIALGYMSLCTYPLNIAKLRRYLEDFVEGKSTDQIRLLKGMADIPAIERSLDLIVQQFNDQVRMLEEEVNSRKMAESLKDDFIGTVSHELRTPLAISKEGISLLLDGIPGEINEKQKKILVTSQRNIDRLARIINDLLDISKIEAGMMVIEKSRTDFVEVVRQTVAAIEPLAVKKGLRMDVDVSDDVIDVYVDQDRIVQVLTNLLSNAVKFTEEGGITVSCREKDGKVECAVSDTGRGMEEDDLPKVFDKFRQFGRTDGAGEKGTGLGMAIARNIVELHGGRIDVSSVPGEGATFTFELPLFTPEKALLDKIDQNLIKEKASGRILTLVLISFEYESGGDTALRSEEFRRFYSKFVESSSVMRDSDLMMSRQDHGVIILGDIKDESLDLVCRRWVNLVKQCFTETHPATMPIVHHATAKFEREGQNAEDLLKHAENQLMLARQAADIRKGDEKDATEDGSDS